MDIIYCDTHYRNFAFNRFMFMPEISNRMVLVNGKHPRSTIFSKSRTNRLPACRIDRRGNDSCRFDRIGFTTRFPVCRIANTKNESTLVGCIGQPSKKKGTVKRKVTTTRGIRI